MKKIRIKTKRIDEFCILLLRITDLEGFLYIKGIKKKEDRNARMLKPFRKKRKNKEDRFMEELYFRYNRLILYVLRKYVSNTAEADDLVQTTLERLMQKVDKLKTFDEQALPAYISETAKHVAFNYLKRRGMEMSLFIPEDFDKLTRSLFDQRPSLDDLLISEERAAICRKELSKLPENGQRLLKGKYMLGMEDEELAKMMNCKPSSVRMKMTRARRMAHDAFIEGGIKDKL